MAFISIPSTGGLWGALSSVLNINFTKAQSNVTGWDDYIIPFSSAKGRGTREPTWEDMGNGHYAYSFDSGDELFTPFHVKHDYKQNTKGYPHVHFCTDEQMNAGETVVWRFGYVVARGHAQGDSLTATETTFDMTYTCTGNEVVGDHIVLECSDAQAFLLREPDTIVSGRYEFISSNTAGRVFGILGDMHVELEGLATLNKAPNFYGV